MRHLARTSLFAALSVRAAIPVHALEPAPAPAASGPDASSLEEVIVEGRRLRKASSPKLTQPLADTPQTIVVIPREVFTQQAQTSLRDVLRNTSGITIQAGEGGSAPGDNIFIRGFGARNDVYIDGVRDPGALNRDTFNIESVEVAKGPASTISGRGSTGGAINLVTRMAGSTDVADFRVTGGTAGYARVAADVGTAFGETGGIRLNAVWTDAGVPGRDVARNRNKGVAPSLALGLGTPTRLYVNLSHLEQDNIPDYGLPATLPQNMPPAQTVEDLDWSNFYGLKSRDHETIRGDQASIIVERDFEGGAKLRNTIRYGRNLRDTVVTPPRAASLDNGGNDPGFDGRITAGHQSARAKDNMQLAEGDPLALRLGGMVLDALDRNPLFVSAALPHKVFPPLFNRYTAGQSFGAHVDNAIRVVRGAGVRVRTDLSATLFLADPDEYDGGELSIEGGFGLQQVKLPAGHMVLYPASSLHRVEPVTRGARVASFF